jgi:hypothetical protein
MYFPIKNHGGIPIMTAHDGGITAKCLVMDTQVGKKKVQPLPHLIGNTVDDLARGKFEKIKTVPISGDPSLTKRGIAGKLVGSTKVKIGAYEELTPEEKETRRLHKSVGTRMRR